jgi:hypothetical protein
MGLTRASVKGWRVNNHDKSSRQENDTMAWLGTHNALSRLTFLNAKQQSGQKYLFSVNKTEE